MANSIWSRLENKPQFEALKKDVKTDVLIVGGGIAGLLCAYMLKNAGVDCVLAEANEICSGITKNTTAKITVQHGLIYQKIAKNSGIDDTRLYLKAQNKALEKFSQLCKEINCDYEEKTAFVYSLEENDKIEREAEILNKIGCPAIVTDKMPLPFDKIKAVGVPKQAQFHPLKFAFEIAKDLPIYEHTKILELGKNCAVTNSHKINFEKIIVATHFPIVNKHGLYFMKLYQHRSYVLALENAPNFEGMYVDENLKGYSFRNYGDLLLLGGGGHRTGKKGGGWKSLEDFAQKNFTGAEIVSRWATQDCMSLDGLPYIGQYSKSTPNMFAATGFNKWGMTSAMVSAMILKDLIRGKENEFAQIFSPSRSVLKPQLLVNFAESTAGILNPKVPRCPHMGCALHYNKFEHSWDCSCHGSRFTKKGKLIDNPSTDDIEL